MAQHLVLVYGNHGKAPYQLDDYVRYIEAAATNLGYALQLSEDPVPGKTNLIIECFDAEYEHKVSVAASQPNTKIIVMATEFITGDTFNDFNYGEALHALKKGVEAPRWTKLVMGRLSTFFFPTILRKLALEIFPKPYFAARELYYSLFGYPAGTALQSKQVLADRFTYFDRVMKVADALWCNTPHQLPAYIKRYGAKVKLMPLVGWDFACINPWQGKLEKDIDFLFTGSLTPYRNSILRELENRGFKVMIGTATWPTHQRDHFIARSKACLQIRQEPNWKYPSVMRYHHLLSSGAVVVAELASESCMQEQYLVGAQSQDFLDTCVRTIKEGNFSERGRKARENYYAGSADGRREFGELLSPFYPEREVSKNVLEPSQLSH